MNVYPAVAGERADLLADLARRQRGASDDRVRGFLASPPERRTSWRFRVLTEVADPLAIGPDARATTDQDDPTKASPMTQEEDETAREEILLNWRTQLEAMDAADTATLRDCFTPQASWCT